VTIPALTHLRTRQKGEEPVDDIGDIFSHSDYFAKLPPIVMDKQCPYFHLKTSAWSNLNKMCIDTDTLKTDLVYTCPWTANRYMWFYPTLLFAEKNVSAWMRAADVEKWHSGSYESYEFDGHRFQLDHVIRSFFGHGFTCGTLPDDGSCHLHDCVIYTTCPGVMVGGKVWVWYNK